MSVDPVDHLRSADRLFALVKVMAVTYRFRPGERINELDLARQLGTSRTPLREALNRLASEGFLTASPNRGFHMRPLDAAELTALYEYRGVVEMGTVRIACERATDEELAALEGFCDAGVQDAGEDPQALHQLRFDEEFHERIAALTGNPEILRAVRGLNERIRFVRWIGLRKGGQRGLPEGHRAILDGLIARDVTGAMALMQRHVAERTERIAEIIRDSFAELYTDNLLAAHLLDVG
jgi:DNA-binding GntR family transcriptional regulator